MSPEQKQMLGYREQDDDGFTYRYGKHKGGYKKQARHTKSIKLLVRNDKRSVKQKEIKYEERLAESA